MITIDKCTESIEIERVNTCPCDDDYYLILQNTATQDTYVGRLVEIESNTLRTRFLFSPSDDMCQGMYEYYLVCGWYDWEALLFKDDIKCSTLTKFLTDCKLLAFNCQLLVDGTPTHLNIISRGLLRYCDSIDEKISKNNDKYGGFRI